MSYNTVLFDMNGVIVDDEPLHFFALQEVLKVHGLPLNQGEYLQFFAGKTDIDGFRAYFSSKNSTFDEKQLMDAKAQKYMESAAGVVQPYPGVVELIQSLAARNIPLGLVTSSLRLEAETVLNTFAIKNFFQGVITADDITKGKPNPEGYLLGATALTVEPKSCIVIEDTPVGIAAAKAAGMYCVAVTFTHAAEELEAADLVLNTLTRDCLDGLLFT